MAIDTEDKRRSAASRGLWKRCFPVPDGTISGVDKQHAASRYRGIAAGIPAAAVYLIAAAVSQYVAGPAASGQYLAGPVAGADYVAGARVATETT